MDHYAPHGRFPTTHWSLVARAGVDDAQAKREALGRLLARYLQALQAHLIYGKRLRPEEAEDLVQEFVASKIIEKDLIGRADRQLGKFRTFLLSSLDRFLIDQIRTSQAKKRAPGEGRMVAIGQEENLLAGAAPPSDAFDVAWARRLIQETLQRMRGECRRSNRQDVWGVFECRLLGPMLKGSKPVDYEVLVQRFALKSPSQASNVLITGKRMFARALRSVVAEYALGEDEIEAEIVELKSILAKSRQ